MTVKIAICAPACPITPDDAARAHALAPAHGATLHFHPQCFASEGHFAGPDALRLSAFLECANDPAFDAVWFARGGYGSNRIAGAAIPQLTPAAAQKTYLGYSDMGYLLAALYRARIGQPTHGPMVADGRRAGGEAALHRALAHLTNPAKPDTTPTIALNLTTLAMLIGTPLMPDLTDHILMVEEVSEHLYAIDRLFFHITAQLPRLKGLRLGRITEIPENDRPFGQTPEQIARHWCAEHAIPFLGEANIGHDAANSIVPFPLALPPQPQ
jgi:muramoyltetrapeptide carboxypeptidase